MHRSHRAVESTDFSGAAPASGRSVDGASPALYRESHARPQSRPHRLKFIAAPFEVMEFFPIRLEFFQICLQVEGVHYLMYNFILQAQVAVSV